MKSAFCLLMTLSIVGNVFAQSPFSQINQTPLLLNSSLAGSKEKKRIGLGLNTLKNGKEKFNNYYISFDQVIRKWGSGLGVYYLYQNYLIDNGSYSPLPNSTIIPDKKLFRSHQAGIMLAPKFNIMKRNQPTKIKYTFSPSLLFEYTNKFVNIDFGNFKDYYSTFYNIDYPSGVQRTDSTLIRTAKNKYQSNNYRWGLGLQLNSENIILLYQFKYSISKWKITESYTVFNNITPLSWDETFGSFTMYGIEQTLNVGITLPKKKAPFSFTPMVGIGFFSPLNSTIYYKQGEVVNEAIMESYWHYRHASAHFKVSKILFGVSYTQYGASYYGATLGYQFPWLKLMSTWNVSSSLLFYSELTANFTF